MRLIADDKKPRSLIIHKNAPSESKAAEVRGKRLSSSFVAFATRLVTDVQKVECVVAADDTAMPEGEEVSTEPCESSPPLPVSGVGVGAGGWHCP